MARGMKRIARLSQAEAISWNSMSRSRRQRRGCWRNNGRGHLSCVAALPFAYNGSGGPASGGFLFSPLLSGDTSVPHNGPFVPSLLFFLPKFNPSSLLLFLPLVSVSTRKQNMVETATIHSPPSPSVLHDDFCLRRPSLCAACVFASASERTEVTPAPVILVFVQE